MDYGALGHWVTVTITGPGQGERIQPTRTFAHHPSQGRIQEAPKAHPSVMVGLGLRQESPPIFICFFCFV